MELDLNDIEESYGDAHPAARVEHADALLGILDERDSSHYVEETLAVATSNERVAIFRALFGISSKSVASRRSVKKTQQGGSGFGPARLYDLLMLADSLHDFGADHRDSVEAAFSHVQMPSGLHHVRDARATIKFLTSPRRKTLRFGDVEEANALCNRNLLDQYDLAKLDPSTPIDKAFESQRASAIGKANAGARVVPCDVWTEYVRATATPSRRLRVIKLEQIARLCGLMHSVFGGRRSCVFLTDSSDEQLVRIVFATSLVRRALFQKFSFDDDVFDEQALVSKMRHIVAREGFSEWRSCVCDANVMDGASHPLDLDVDARPTGAVYRPGLPFQIALEGCQPEMTTKVVFRDADRTRTYSINARSRRFSTSVMSSDIDNIAAGDLLKATVSGRLALKRACDWGQVEHCRKYGLIFVSSDKLAVLYAMFRGVKSVLLRRAEHEARGVLPELLQYTFAICA
jgi:hypothetical protein